MGAPNHVEITLEHDDDEVDWALDMQFENPATKKDVVEAIATILHVLCEEEGLTSSAVLRHVIQNNLKLMDAGSSLN